MSENRGSTTSCAVEIISRGLDAAELGRWPRINLPAYIEANMRRSEADWKRGEIDLGPPNVLTGIEMKWGVITAGLEEAPHLSQGAVVLNVDAYLNEDLLVELDPLCVGIDDVGIFLSDFSNAVLQEGLSNDLLCELSALGLDWVDADNEGHLFSFFGIDYPHQALPYDSLGLLVAEWLKIAQVENVLRMAQRPTTLRRVVLKPELPVYGLTSKRRVFR